MMTSQARWPRMRENMPVSIQNSHLLAIHKYLRIRAIVSVNNIRVLVVGAGQTSPGD